MTIIDETPITTEGVKINVHGQEYRIIVRVYYGEKYSVECNVLDLSGITHKVVDSKEKLGDKADIQSMAEDLAVWGVHTARERELARDVDIDVETAVMDGVAGVREDGEEKKSECRDGGSIG